MKYLYKKITLLMVLSGTLFSCNDYLDKEPKSHITPDYYFNDDAQLGAYANRIYTDVLPSHTNWSYGIFGIDAQTDNQTGKSYDKKYVKGLWKVPQSENSDWNFERINSCNYFLEQVLPKYETGQISGSDAIIRHYIGEIYFLRAYELFTRYQKFGDFPIITKALPDEAAVLIEANKRFPRNEVARFILEDLDKAAEYMKDVDMAATRINRNVALLIKSRVALYEASWLKNFQGTAFVPGTNDWPGKSKDYNAGFTFKSGSVEAEYNWFFEQAMEASKEIGDQIINNLVPNTAIVPQTQTSVKEIDAANPYMAMFGTEELSSYPEVLMWRQYSKGLDIVHYVVVAAQRGNFDIGVTRGLVENFLMKNGLPIYSAASGYHGDNTIADVRRDRDPRLNVFLKEPGQKNILITNADGTHAIPEEPIPNILYTSATERYTTGYVLRKGGSFDQGQCAAGKSYTACVIFRGVEALLNYIEASYERNGTLDATAKAYWTAIRARHVGMDTDFQKTISHTDIVQEAKNDWGAYTAGEILTDATLYNIRRERRCELMAEGLRWMDLCRWRALEQMITTPYHIEGIHVWNTPMEKWYDENELASIISSSDRSEYLRPYEADPKSEVFNGYTWSMAQYLHPIMIKQFLLTASDGTTISTSPLYQNPYWPLEADMPAQQ